MRFRGVAETCSSGLFFPRAHLFRWRRFKDSARTCGKFQSTDISLIRRYVLLDLNDDYLLRINATFVHAICLSGDRSMHARSIKINYQSSTFSALTSFFFKELAMLKCSTQWGQFCCPEVRL